MAKLQGGTRIYGTANVDTYLYVNTYTIVNATGIYQTGVINATSHTVGTNFFANTTQLYHTGTLNIGTGSFVVNTSQVTLSGPLSANGSTGTATYILTSNGSVGSPYWASAGTAITRYINMSQPGTNTGPYVGTARFYPADNITVNQIFASVSQTPSASCIFKIFKNGIDTGYTFTINSGSNTLTPTSVSIIVATTDYLTINLVSGSFVDFRVQLAYS